MIVHILNLTKTVDNEEVKMVIMITPPSLECSAVKIYGTHQFRLGLGQNFTEWF